MIEFYLTASTWYGTVVICAMQHVTLFLDEYQIHGTISSLEWFGISAHYMHQYALLVISITLFFWNKSILTKIATIAAGKLDMYEICMPHVILFANQPT